MNFAGEHSGGKCGRISLFTRAQHLEALASFREKGGRRGVCAWLSRKYGITSSAMRTMLKRAEQLEREAATCSG